MQIIVKKTWNLIKDLLKTKCNHNDNFFIKINGIISNDSFTISSHFNNYFSQIAHDLNKDIPSTSTDPLSYLHLTSNTSCYFLPTDPNELISIVKNLKNSFSVGSDGIALKYIKCSIYSIADILSDLINLSLSTGVFPDSLKMAIVTPVFKTGDKTEYVNYRPISILPFYSKIFEKVVHTRLLSYFDSNNLFYKNQFGFRKNYSTELLLSLDLNS